MARVSNRPSGRGGDFALSVTSSQNWAHSFSPENGRIVFTVDANDSEPGSEPRQTLLTFSYPGARSVETTLFQAAPDAIEPPQLTFALTIPLTTPSAVTVSCLPSDPAATFILRTISKSEYEAYGSDLELIADDIAYFQGPSWTGEPGQIADYLRAGEIVNEEFAIFSTDPHYLYAYGLDPDGTVTSDLFKKEFSVPERPVIQIAQPDLFPVDGGTFTVGYTIVHPLEGGAIEITPSPSDWIHDIEVTDNEIRFTVDPNTSAEPDSEPRESHFNVSYPEAYNQFVAIRQAAPALDRLDFDLQILSLSCSEVRVRCIPSDAEATYVLRMISKSEYDDLGGDQALVASDIEAFLKPDWLGNPGRIDQYLISGDKEDFFSLFSSAPQYVYAYGLTADGTATTPVVKTEITPPERPQINASNPDTLPLEGGIVEVTYTIDHPVGDRLPTIETAWGLEWAHDFTVTPAKITFVLDPNTAAEPGSEPRTSFFRIQYPDAYDKVITLRQPAPDRP